MKLRLWVARGLDMSRLGLAVLLAVLMGTLAAAAEPPPPIRAFPLATIESLGRDMARRDAAAWVASDALQAKVRDFQNAGLIGWIVVDVGENQRVRFLRDTGKGPEAGYDFDVSPSLATTLVPIGDRTLTADELSQLAAIATARRGMEGQPVCRSGYNHVALRDPEGGGWLVWMLAPMPAVNSIPFGGHYRFSVSKDGRTLLRRDALSASCISVSTDEIPKGLKDAVVGVGHLVSGTPVETHVFLQLQSKQTVLVIAGGRMWKIDRGRITDGGEAAVPKPAS
jgi:hypothetical protein